MKQTKKGALKTEWNLKLFYKSHNDPQIEIDLKKTEKAYTGFEKKYKIKDFIKDENNLFKALADYEILTEEVSSNHAFMYFHSAKDLNASDQKAEAAITQIIERLAKASNKIIFFELAVGRIPEEKQKQYLNSNKLKHFNYLLKGIFERARYNLSEAEEKILSLKSQPAHELWISGFDKLLSKQTVMWKNNELPLSKALSSISSLPIKDRYALQEKVLTTFKSISDFAEAEINAIYIDKKINDELRGLKNPYDATLLNHETDEKMVKALNLAVTKGYGISHRFYKLKAKLLKLKKLSYADRGVGIGKSVKVLSFEEGLKVVRDSFNEMDPHFAHILDSYLKNGQIDVYPKKGKTGGAYCWSNINTPTLVLLNHSDKMKEAMTLAHEIGHAIHGEYSKSQTPFYQGHSTAVAEVASTFFEQVVFDNVFKTLSPKEQIIALHDRINDTVSTIFRQMACFNFELNLHKAIREKGSVSKEEIAVMMNKEMKAYLGPVFDLKELDGYFFVNWSHIRRFFYVYSYAYGCLISRVLYKKYKEDPSYLEKVKQFLSAGNSKSPYDIFNEIGIDTSHTTFWEEGLKSIEEEVKLLEKLSTLSVS